AEERKQCGFVRAVISDKPSEERGGKRGMVQFLAHRSPHLGTIIYQTPSESFMSFDTPEQVRVKNADLPAQVQM
ncbi:uncharacterized, partial [Tachysurus ichikawai]